MKAYILSIAGVILLSAVISAITPKGKLGDFIKGMGKLVVLTVIIAPFVTNLKKGEFPFLSTVIAEDTAYFERSARLLEEREQEAIDAMLFEEFGVLTQTTVTAATDGTYTFQKISVKISDFGIFGQDEHINIISRIQERIFKNYGCDAEVYVAESIEGE